MTQEERVYLWGRILDKLFERGSELRLDIDEVANDIAEAMGIDEEHMKLLHGDGLRERRNNNVH